jgi:hypothetical protein
LREKYSNPVDCDADRQRIIKPMIAIIWQNILHLASRWREARHNHPAPSALLPFAPLARWQLLAELLLVVLLALVVTRHLLPYDPNTRMSGLEHEWLTGMGHVAHVQLHEHGYLPLWNPIYRAGEPLIGNAFSFILNPFSSVPILLFGGAQGAKYAIVLGTIIVGIGGWVLARVLGLSVFGRILLAVLLMGKGNMHAMLGEGYYQLGLQQVYFPYIMAGAFAVMRGGGRWSIVLTGLATALMFMAGNVWYILPAIISMGAIVLTHLSGVSKERVFNGRGLAGMVLAGGIMLGVSAPYTLPVLAHYDHIGNHGDECQAGWEIKDFWRAPALYVVDDPIFASFDLTIYDPCYDHVSHSNLHFHYSFVTPAWLVLLILVLLPPVRPFLHRPALAYEGRIVWTMILLIMLFTLWGMGGSPLWEALYGRFELLRGWRFVGRAMAMGAFWVAVLVALRADGLARALWAYRGAWRYGALGGLVALFVVAQTPALVRWYGNLPPTERYVNDCIAEWQNQGQRDESLWISGYEVVWGLADRGISLSHIEADFLPLPEATTISNPAMYLFTELPEYALPNFAGAYTILENWDYQPYQRVLVNDRLCLFYNPALGVPYAFTMSPERYEQLGVWEDLRPFAQRISTYNRLPDTIALKIPASEEARVLTLRELAYPGWQVWVNGERATLDVVGGLVSVVLPASDSAYEVVFMFRPPLHFIGAGVHLMTALGVVVFLLWGKRPDALS